MARYKTFIRIGSILSGRIDLPSLFLFAMSWLKPPLPANRVELELEYPRISAAGNWSDLDKFGSLAEAGWRD
jgi:hypothetical protein